MNNKREMEKSNIFQIRVPEIGSFENVSVIDVLVKEGDAVDPSNVIVSLESDKATMDIPSPATGVVQEVIVKIGDRVSKNSLLLSLFISDEDKFVLAQNLKQSAQSLLKKDVRNRKIFIVHGHDHGPLEAVARFLHQLEFEPIILHESPSKGRTIIEKFYEEAANVSLAIVIMTPDDHGCEVSSTALRLRARQNVIFELGFFVGVLGRGHVVALVKGNVETPSDYDGVAYIVFDKGNWKIDLANELHEAGFEVDLKNLLGKKSV